MGYQVKDIMKKSVVSLGREDQLRDAYNLMVAHQMRHLIVVDCGRPCGVVSERDIFLKSRHGFFGLEIPTITLGEVMSSALHTVSPGADLATAAHDMVSLRIGSLPVVDAAGFLLGLVTRTDLLSAMASLGSRPTEAPREGALKAQSPLSKFRARLSYLA
jgi:CBS domain-containing protein